MVTASESPLFQPKNHDQPSVFQVDSLIREACRQRGLNAVPVPDVSLLDPDGDPVRHPEIAGAASRHQDWACYHFELWLTTIDNREIEIVPCAVGAPFRSPDRRATGAPPYFVLIERAWRDEGTSLHYLPTSEWCELSPALSQALDGAFETMDEPVHRGSSWTTDAPFRETDNAINRARQAGIHAVEMEAAALYAYAQARARDVVYVAHVTNSMATDGEDLEGGEVDGTDRILALAAAIAAALRPT